MSNPAEEAGPSMRAVAYARFGDPEVLDVHQVPRPDPGHGRIRIAVRASSVNRFDLKKRSGAFCEAYGPDSPVIPGVEAAGVVDGVGDGVADVSIGDEVFGLGPSTFAEFAVLEHWAAKPAAWTWSQAASVSTAAEAAERALDLLEVQEGHTLLIDGAAGSVGTAAAQLAIAKGLAVVGTGSSAKHARLSRLGVAPTTYGPGLPDRVAELVTDSVDRVLDASGKGSLDELIAIAGSPEAVITLADFDAPDKGVRVTSKPYAFDALGTVAGLAANGRFEVLIDSEFPLAEAAAAHSRAEAGADGKVVVTL